ncbi:MAG: hypothetical protein JXA97_04660 [Anaerolineales bacterium]|nr:hypothetical protein [Anaerolineales bacterium]
MDRTVPRTGSEEIELYIRTYYSLLRTTTDVRLRTLEEVHTSMGSSLHPDAKSNAPDISALVYSSLRLPACMRQIERVVLGLSPEAFQQGGLGIIEDWTPVNAKARRRRTFFDGDHTLAVYIASLSDIDDMIPILTAYQVEWNKLHTLLSGEQVRKFLATPLSHDSLAVLSQGIGLALEDLERLKGVWGDEFWTNLQDMAAARKRIQIRLLGGSLNDYRRTTRVWWERIEATRPELQRRPIYFISSNTHSVVNLLSGLPLRHEADMIRFLEETADESLKQEWEQIETQQIRSSRENFLYYLSKKMFSTEKGRNLELRARKDEEELGIHRVESRQSFDIEAQVIELKQLQPERMDPRLKPAAFAGLSHSDALIVNIDYPLGVAAYLILTQIASRVGEIRGIYLMGKAATLNGRIGDVLIPSVVHDEHSQNTYLIPNCFNASDVNDDLMYGTVLDNQKAVSVRGTFLQTPRYMDVFYREGYTDIEMEAGPYLSGVYELTRPKRYPENEIVDLHGVPFDVGILHYASDTPMSKGKNLGAGSLSYFGMDPAYATSLAVLRRIFENEQDRIS